MKAWDGVFTAPVAGRATKPRKTGYTMVIDKGLGLNATSDLMASAADYIDSLKLTFGTSAFFDADLLKQKTQIVRQAGVDIYPGGTFFEVAVWQNTVDKYLDRCHELGFTAVEISGRHHRDGCSDAHQGDQGGAQIRVQGHQRGGQERSQGCHRHSHDVR